MSQIDTTPQTDDELRDTILTADDLGEQIVDVPEWGRQVLIHGFDGIMRSKVQNLATVEGPEQVYQNADILIIVARNPATGNLMFDKADREALSKKSGAAVERIVLAAIRMSGSSIDEAEQEVAADPTLDGA